MQHSYSLNYDQPWQPYCKIPGIQSHWLPCCDTGMSEMWKYTQSIKQQTPVGSNVYLIHLYDCLSYLACKANLFCTALYWLLWPGWLYQIFPHYLINGMIFRNNLLKTKRVFSFSLLLSETFLILRKTGQDTIINLHRSSCKVPFILVRF